jgi:integrase
VEIVPATEDLGEDLDDPILWEPQDTARSLEHVAGDRLAALYELAAYAGLRSAELCGLRWSYLDDDGAGLTVRQTIVEVSRAQGLPRQAACPVCAEERSTSRDCSNGPSRARVAGECPSPAPACDVLDRHRKAQQEDRDYLGAGYSDHDLVFADYAGLPLRPGNVTAAFEAHVAACGLPVIRLHDTRHGACALPLAGGGAH